MISISGISKDYGTLGVFQNLTGEIASGSIVSVVGPSGCGKSTLLNIICGIDKPDSGSIRIGAAGRPAGYMMQEPHLLPWRTLAENALLGVEVVRELHTRDGLLRHYFEAFELDAHYETYPSESSGGMKQRAALIRTLLLKPSLLLLDEPFSGLDFDIKLKVQREIVRYQQSSSATTVLVTHDIEDAIALSDKVLVFSEAPAQIKAEIPIELGVSRKDPVEARKSERFREYFVEIWDQLKYLDEDYVE
jgi:NitT/TauT family transport system ATP-binding protein